MKHIIYSAVLALSFILLSFSAEAHTNNNGINDQLIISEGNLSFFINNQTTVPLSVERDDPSKKRALIIVTNHSDFENEEADPTGLWFSELTHFYEVFDKAGIPMDIVSISGGKIPIDNRSLTNFMLDKESEKYYEDPEFMALLENTSSLSEIRQEDYDIIYLAGGHGAMWDLANSEQLSNMIAEMYEDGKVVAAVCHGVAGLQNVKLSNGEYLIKGKKGTGFSYFDEGLARVKKYVPYSMQSRLQDRGMKYSKAFIPFGKHSVVDGRLITGQNPNSAKKAAENALEVLLSL